MLSEVYDNYMSQNKNIDTLDLLEIRFKTS